MEEKQNDNSLNNNIEKIQIGTNNILNDIASLLGNLKPLLISIKVSATAIHKELLLSIHITLPSSVTDEKIIEVSNQLETKLKDKWTRNSGTDCKVTYFRFSGLNRCLYIVKTKEQEATHAKDD